MRVCIRSPVTRCAVELTFDSTVAKHSSRATVARYQKYMFRSKFSNVRPPTADSQVANEIATQRRGNRPFPKFCTLERATICNRTSRKPPNKLQSMSSWPRRPHNRDASTRVVAANALQHSRLSFNFASMATRPTFTVVFSSSALVSRFKIF